MNIRIPLLLTVLLLGTAGAYTPLPVNPTEQGMAVMRAGIEARARAAVDEGDYESGLKLFGELAARFGDPDGRYAFGSFRCRYVHDARAPFDSLRAAWPEAPWLPLLDREAGHALFRQQRYYPALAAYLKADSLRPGILDTPLASRVRFGYALMWADSLERAVRMFTPLRDDSLLGDYALQWLADCYGRMDSTERRMIELHRLTTRWPASTLAGPARMEMAGFYYDNGFEDEALSLYRDGDAFATGSEEAVLVRFRSGELFRARNDAARADSAYLSAMNRYPAAQWAWEARLALITYRSGRKAPLRGPEIYADARVLAAHGQHGAAAKRALKFAGANPDSPLCADALYLAGLSRYRQKKYRQADINFSRLLSRFPGSPLAGDALLHSARCKRKMKQTAAAEKEYRQLAEKYPGHKAADDALWSIAWNREVAGELTAAATAYRELSRRLPETRLGAEAVWRRGYCLYKSGKYTAALKAFTEVDSSAELYLADQALYWRAKCRSRMGEPGAADELYRRAAFRYPRTYYSVKAAEHLGMVPAPAPDSLFRYGLRTEDLMTEVHGAYWLRYSDSLAGNGAVDGGMENGDHALRKATALLRLYLYDEGLDELVAFENGAGERRGSLVELARIYFENGFTYRAYRTFRHLLDLTYGSDSDAFPLGAFRFLYPVNYLETIRRFTREYGDIDPFLVLALIHQESRFNPAARSHAGARGLMQIMPATGAEIARRLKAGAFHADSLYNPDVNLRFGIAYLAGQLVRFEGDPVHTLASYNGGGTNVRRWIKRFRGSDPDVFVEDIPFRETRKYVKIVLRNYRLYRFLWGPYCLRGREDKP